METRKKKSACLVLIIKVRKLEFAHFDPHIFKHLQTLTLRLLWDGHAQPLQVDAVLAADAGGPTAEGMERDGAHDQRQLQAQLGRSRNINTNLRGRKRRELLDPATCTARRNTAWTATADSAHLEHVLHFDDAALQDGGPHRRDFDGASVPCFPALSAHNVAGQCGHHRVLLLHRAAGDERLRLSDVGFGHDGSGGRVVELREDGYHLTCTEEKWN